MLQHEIHQVRVTPFGVLQPEFVVRRAFLTQQLAWAMPIKLSSSSRRSLDGGVLRYSMTSGSTPLLRMRANVLREVPQAGLW